MTDRVRVLIVYLDREMREDDAEVVIGAITQNRHVSHVVAAEDQPSNHAIEVAKIEMRQSLLDFVHGPGRR